MIEINGKPTSSRSVTITNDAELNCTPWLAKGSNDLYCGLRDGKRIIEFNIASLIMDSKNIAGEILVNHDGTQLRTIPAGSICSINDAKTLICKRE